MDDPVRPTPDTANFAPRCISVDLEVGVADSRIHQFAAVRGDTDQAYTFRKGNLAKALAELDTFAEGVNFLLGHNLVAFDLPHLAAAKPDMRLLKLPAVDTLRLNPLAFPRNPYHHLVKHYQDGQLKRGRLNDPELDARLTLEVFRDQHSALRALKETSPDLLLAWHWLTTVDETASGLNAFFTKLRRKLRPTDVDAKAAIERCLADQACITATREMMADAESQGWPLAYTLAWLSVSGGNSVMPPWVRHQFPEAGALVRRLRDTACTDPACAWCRERHDARKELTRWFGFTDFRPNPLDDDGRPLQQVDCGSSHGGQARAGNFAHGYGQILVLSDSRAVALRQNRRADGGDFALGGADGRPGDRPGGARDYFVRFSINGLLSMPERADALDRVRLGDVGILIVVARAIAQPRLAQGAGTTRDRCLGAGRSALPVQMGTRLPAGLSLRRAFHQGKAGEGPVPPMLCLTATAKPDVVTDIVEYFGDKLGIELRYSTGAPNRTNLGVRRRADHQLPRSLLTSIRSCWRIFHPDMPGGAIVYLRHADANGGDCGISAGKRNCRRLFSCGTEARDQERRSRRIYSRRPACHSRHQCLRHGHRQARCALGDPRRHSRFAGKLSAGGRARWTRSGGGTLCSALYAGGCRAAVWHVCPFAPDSTRDSGDSQGTAQPRSKKRLRR